MEDDEKRWRNADSGRNTSIPKRNLCDACLEARKLYNLCIEIDVSGLTTSKIPFDQPDAVIKRTIYKIGMICREYELHDELDQLSNNAASKHIVKLRDGNDSEKRQEKSQLTSSRPKTDIDRRRLPNNAPPSSENPFYHVFHATLPETAVIKKPSAKLKKSTSQIRA